MPDAFDLAASLLPDDREYQFHEFAELARLRGLARDKVSAEGLLLSLRVNGAVSATGVPPVVTKRERPPEAKRLPPRPVFTPTGSPDVVAENRRLARENADLRARLEELGR